MTAVKAALEISQNTLVSPEMAKEIQALAAKERASAEYSIRSLMKQLEDAQKRAAQVEDEAAKRVAMKARLVAAGFENVVVGYYSNEVTVRVEEKQLKDVYRVVGRLALEDKSVENPRKRTVEITLRSTHNPFVVVRYVKKLPKEAKCKIVAKRTRPSTYHSLVCEM